MNDSPVHRKVLISFFNDSYFSSSTVFSFESIHSLLYVKYDKEKLRKKFRIGYNSEWIFNCASCMKGNPTFSRGTGKKKFPDPIRRETSFSRNIGRFPSFIDKASSTMRELSLMAGSKVVGGKKTRGGSLIRTHCARMMPAPRRRVLASFVAVEVVCRPSSAPSSGTSSAAPC